jgi:N-glycosylase/DNA lyase
VYKSVGDHFRRRFSPFAGWAHSVLFTGDLTAFQSHLPTDMQKKKKNVKTQVKKKVVGRIKAPGKKAR